MNEKTQRVLTYVLLVLLAFAGGYYACHIRHHHTQTDSPSVQTPQTPPKGLKIDTIQNVTPAGFAPNSVDLSGQLFKVNQGTKVANDDYFMYGLIFNASGTTITGLSYVDIATGVKILNNGGGSYTWQSVSPGMISPTSFTTTQYPPLEVSSLKMSKGLISGTDANGTIWNNIIAADIYTITGSGSTVTFGVVNLETLNFTDPQTLKKK